MKHKIFPFDAGCTCYLIETQSGFILIDTGLSMKRSQVEFELENAGCTPGKLRLIILTHGDPDHTGNARFLKEKFGATIAMGADDFGMVERGDRKWNRKTVPDRISPALKQIIESAPSRPGSQPFEKFAPDLAVDEGFDLAPYGLDAQILRLPGHSKGSIGVLTKEGELFCGDLIFNVGPDHYYEDDATAHASSMQKIKKLDIQVVYPGHGSPFPLEEKAPDYHRPTQA